MTKRPKHRHLSAIASGKKRKCEDRHRVFASAILLSRIDEPGLSLYKG